MITTGQVLSEGTQTFTPMMIRVLDIVNEISKYLVFIFIGVLGVRLIWRAVKYILEYLKKKNFSAFYYYVDDDYHGRIRLKRKHIKWKNIKHFR